MSPRETAPAGHCSSWPAAWRLRAGSSRPVASVTIVASSIKGRWRWRASNTSAAIEAFSGAVALKSDSMLGYLRRGEAYRRRKRLDDALRGPPAGLRAGPHRPASARARLATSTLRSSDTIARPRAARPTSRSTTSRRACSTSWASCATGPASPLRGSPCFERRSRSTRSVLPKRNTSSAFASGTSTGMPRRSLP